MSKEKKNFLAIYMDDGILIENNEFELNDIIKKIEKEFEIK